MGGWIHRLLGTGLTIRAEAMRETVELAFRFEMIGKSYIEHRWIHASNSISRMEIHE
jgi:hypothetical protein